MSETQRSAVDPTKLEPDGHAEALRKIADILDGLRFGSIEVVVHEGRVVQIERREKLRVR